MFILLWSPVENSTAMILYDDHNDLFDQQKPTVWLFWLLCFCCAKKLAWYFVTMLDSASVSEQEARTILNPCWECTWVFYVSGMACWDGWRDTLFQSLRTYSQYTAQHKTVTFTIVIGMCTPLDHLASLWVLFKVTFCLKYNQRKVNVCDVML